MQKNAEDLKSDGSLTKRWILYILGIYILTVGVSLAIKAGIGISPQSSLTRVMTVVYPNLSQGTYNFILEIIMLILTFVVLPKGFQLKYFTSLIPSFVLAVCLDFNLKITSFIHLDWYVSKLLLLVVGDAALAFGLFLMIRADLVLMPIDLFVHTLVMKTQRKWGNIKTIFDCSLLVISASIGLIFLNQIMFIREGTVLNAIFVGQYLILYSYIYRKLKAKKDTADNKLIDA